jgi:hypothetical protein
LQGDEESPGKKKELISQFEAALSAEVRKEILDRPKIAMTTLNEYDPRFGDSELWSVLEGIFGDWLDFNRGAKKKRGPKHDPVVQNRRKILRSIIKERADFKNDAKVRSLFAALEQEPILIPGSNNSKWMHLLNDPLRCEEKKAALSVLHKDFSRSN